MKNEKEFLKCRSAFITFVEENPGCTMHEAFHCFESYCKIRNIYRYLRKGWLAVDFEHRPIGGGPIVHPYRLYVPMWITNLKYPDGSFWKGGRG